MQKRGASRGSQVGRRLGVSAVMGAVIVLPLVTMEWRAGGGFPAGVPIALFTVLWFLAVAFCLAAWPAVRRLEPRAGGWRVLPPAWAALALALLFALLWISLVRDQWPCFRGLPNCD